MIFSAYALKLFWKGEGKGHEPNSTVLECVILSKTMVFYDYIHMHCYRLTGYIGLNLAMIT